MAEHPFILEYPVIMSNIGSITNYRRISEHRRLTLLLNILLVRRTSVQPRQIRHFWASVPRDDGADHEIKWVQEFFFTNFGEIVTDALSPLTSKSIEEVAPETYYTCIANDGGDLRVPDDLDDSICCYVQLSPRTGPIRPR